jgi:hypothetical protein
MNENQDIVKYEEIPPAVIDTLLEDANKMALWVKPKGEGFYYKENYLKTITGIITKIEPYWAMWEDGKIIKSFDKHAPDDDFVRRCDVSVRTRDNFVIRVSLPKSSYNNLATYVKVLRGRRLEIHKIPTLLSCEEVNGSYGVFTVVNFTEAADDVSPGQFEVVEGGKNDETEVIDEEDDIPF